MKIVPISLRQAAEFTTSHHRHNVGAKGHKFSIGLQDSGGVLVGVATVGRPIARHVDDGQTAEVTRVCVLEGNRNANSMLYGAACRACKAMGYKSVVTYTLKTESGSSLKASGFVQDGEVKLNKTGWNMPNRKRKVQEVSLIPKIRWRRIL